MAPKLSRTPRSLRARQNQDPGGTRKDKKLPVPGLKEHGNPQVKGGLHKTTDMEKDTRYSVPTMFTSVMRLKQMSTEKAVCDSQSNVPGVNDEQDIGARIATMETRTEELGIEVKAATAQTTTQGQQISDIQWKLEDAENRQRRNNLRILGIAEDLEVLGINRTLLNILQTDGEETVLNRNDRRR
ncbi:hypothetical protein NDU88_004917 [Pleurodeles waltl]|uniref:Uncharacterized protein n=1 Tax=Pleurodeles waltl TaxID=8319 RepID=A0AAV7KZ53_PLEWA|nr:hypothetical protein NDU88_004917 [Pleurodeles waltl]